MTLPEWIEANPKYTPVSWSDVWDAATLAERERCAKLADLYRREKGMLNWISGESPETIWETATGSVAAAIRGQDAQ